MILRDKNLPNCKACRNREDALRKCYSREITEDMKRLIYKLNQCEHSGPLFGTV
jgi:hypothetical protein